MKNITRRIITSKREVNDLTKAWFVISVAFGIAISKQNGVGLFSTTFLFYILASAITAGAGFLLHELAHKVVAQRYGCLAEFRSQDSMLLIALLFSFFGTIFAAPGAVMIQGHVNRIANGKISVAGPAMNIFLASIFWILTFVPITLVAAVASFGVMINAWLALFNMIPFWIFDGRKIWDWSKPVWVSIVIVAGLFLVL